MQQRSLGRMAGAHNECMPCSSRKSVTATARLTTLRTSSWRDCTRLTCRRCLSLRAASLLARRLQTDGVGRECEQAIGSGDSQIYRLATAECASRRAQHTADQQQSANQQPRLLPVGLSTTARLHLQCCWQHSTSTTLTACRHLSVLPPHSAPQEQAAAGSEAVPDCLTTLPAAAAAAPALCGRAPWGWSSVTETPAACC